MTQCRRQTYLPNWRTVSFYECHRGWSVEKISAAFIIGQVHRQLQTPGRQREHGQQHGDNPRGVPLPTSSGNSGRHGIVGNLHLLALLNCSPSAAGPHVLVRGFDGRGQDVSEEDEGRADDDGTVYTYGAYVPPVVARIGKHGDAAWVSARPPDLKWFAVVHCCRHVSCSVTRVPRRAVYVGAVPFPVALLSALG